MKPFGDADAGTVARRAAVAMTTGFAVGPLVAGVLAQWAPQPAVVPYLPHIALTADVASLRSPDCSRWAGSHPRALWPD